MKLPELNREEIIGDDFFAEAKTTLGLVTLTCIGIFGAVSWNTMSLNLGIDALNSALVRGGVLVLFLVVTLKLDITYSQDKNN